MWLKDALHLSTAEPHTSMGREAALDSSYSSQVGATVCCPRRSSTSLEHPPASSTQWVLHKSLWNCPVHPWFCCLLSGHSPSTADASDVG